MHRFAYFVVLAGCATESSKSLLTSGMSALVSVTTDGGGTTDVSASLFDGYPVQLVFVDLAGTNDRLVATHAGQAMTLAKNQLVTIIDYDATFATGSEGDEFTIALQRTVDAGAPSSTATLPAPFALGALPSSSSRAASLTVTWSPAGTTDLIDWQARGDCIANASAAASAPDTGSLVIPANTFVKESGSGVADTCT